MADEILCSHRRRCRHRHPEPSDKRNAMNTALLDGCGALLDELRTPARCG
jgi:hypothetical protein